MRELRMVVLGNVDAGKSSLTGVLTKNILDDGRGYARSLVAQFSHEKCTGKTSSVTQNFSKDSNGKIVVYIDLAGHEKYLKTTLHGMTGYYPDYGMIVVGANMGVTDITKEHINIAIALNIPFMVVITKIDIAPPHILEKTKNHIEEIIKSKLKQKSLLYIESEEDALSLQQIRKYVPIFCVSNKDGTNIETLRSYINHVYDFYNIHHKALQFHTMDELKDTNIFSIDRSYQVNGVGTVISGRVCNGSFRKNENVFVGPFHGMWYPVLIRTFHDNFQQNIDHLNVNESGCIAIKSLTKGVDLKKLDYRKGLYLMSGSGEECKKFTVYEFEADVIIMHTHSTTIAKNYQPIINCNKIVQSAKIVDIYEKTHIRAGDKCRIKFRFMHRPEFLQEDDKFIFREGQTRGIGIIRKLFCESG
jgi:elongation factor 1-alpha